MATLIAVSNLTATVTPMTINSSVPTEKAPFEAKTSFVAPHGQLADLIKAEALKHQIDPDLALAISTCESNIRQFGKTGEVIRGIQNPMDVGLFQINEHYHLETSKELGYNIYTPKGNVDYAMMLLKRDGSRHWNSSKPCWGSKVAYAI